MLVLARRLNESIMIGDEIEVVVIDIKGDQVKLGIRAPKRVTVHRKEIYEEIRKEKKAEVYLHPDGDRIRSRRGDPVYCRRWRNPLPYHDPHSSDVIPDCGHHADGR